MYISLDKGVALPNHGKKAAEYSDFWILSKCSDPRNGPFTVAVDLRTAGQAVELWNNQKTGRERTEQTKQATDFHKSTPMG